MESTLKKTLESLCCSNGWSYGVFWRFDHPNSMLLTLEDAYYEEQMGVVIDSMLLQVHLLGEGIIGQTAFDGKQRWIFSDVHSGDGNTSGYDESQDIFQDDSEIIHQFSSGIKTIVVISVEPRGVVQFGSTQKIVESLEFLDQTRRFFRDMEYVDGFVVSRNAPSTLDIESYDSSGLLASLISSGSANDGNSKLNTPLHQLFSHSTTFVNKSDDAPCSSTWSREDSSVTSLEQRFPSEMVKASPYVFPTKTDAQVSCINPVQNFQGGSTFNSLCNTSKLLECSNPFYAAERELLESSSSMLTFQEEFKPAELPSYLSKLSDQVDDISQWLAPSPDQRLNGLFTTLDGLFTTLDDDLSRANGVTSVSSGLNGGGVFNETPANSLQSSVTNTLKTDGNEIFFNAPMADNDPFDFLGGELGFGKMGEIWEDFAVPVVNGGQSTVSNGMSGISELDVGSMAVPRKGLFSELGLEQLLDEIVGNSNHVCKSTSEDQLSTNKRRKTGSNSVNGNPIQFAGLSCLTGKTNFLKPLNNLDNTTTLDHQKEVFPKSQVGLWIDDSYSINAGSAVMSQSKRPEEPAKTTKKRAKPGESTKARPKDRQQIQDRLSELRKIIPNTVKLSIDSLLDRTIKHMLFLQSVAKYAEKLKQVDEPKLIGQENGVVLKDKSSGGGATWAFEVGSKTMVCPIIVEDLGPPGQMLIEMLCEERGLFLEIADIVRGFGLNILKGVMEIRENKIWTRFIVEANKHVTRMDIFWSLIHLLQQPVSNGADSTNQPNNVLDGKSPLFNNYQQLPVL